jgi:hypothetical protein
MINPLSLADDPQKKEMILDIMAEMNDDTIINLEMQVINNHDYWYDTEIKKRDAALADKDATIADKDATIANQGTTIADLKAEIAALQAQLTNK